MQKEEYSIVDLFLKKTGKVPALVEVMRPYVDREEAFDLLIKVHTEIMIESTKSGSVCFFNATFYADTRTSEARVLCLYS